MTQNIAPNSTPQPTPAPAPDLAASLPSAPATPDGPVRIVNGQPVPLSDAEQAALASERAAWAQRQAVPAAVTMRQARLALLGAGLLSRVDAAIAAMPAPERSAAVIFWEYSTTVERSNAFVRQLSAGLQLTSQQVDALFVAAAGL